MLYTLQAWISSPSFSSSSSSWTSNSCEWFKCPMLCKSWLKFTTMQLYVCFLLMGWNLFLVGFFHVGYPNSFQNTTYWCCNGNVKKVVEIVNFRFFFWKTSEVRLSDIQRISTTDFTLTRYLQKNI
jgi:hypothetical protein